MADPTAVQVEGFGILFIPLSANFFMDICLCYHKSNDAYYVRIKMMEFVPYVPAYASQLDYYTPGSMQLDGGDLTKIHLNNYLTRVRLSVCSFVRLFVCLWPWSRHGVICNQAQPKPRRVAG